MKKILRILACLMVSASTVAMAEEINNPITVYTLSNWSNVRVVNINNPGIVCHEAGRVTAGSTLYFSKDDLNSKEFTPCNSSEGFGLIFYGNTSNRPFPPQTAKSGQRCTASYKLLGNRLVFECSNM